MRSRTWTRASPRPTTVFRPHTLTSDVASGKRKPSRVTTSRSSSSFRTPDTGGPDDDLIGHRNASGRRTADDQMNGMMREHRIQLRTPARKRVGIVLRPSPSRRRHRHPPRQCEDQLRRQQPARRVGRPRCRLSASTVSAGSQQPGDDLGRARVQIVPDEGSFRGNTVNTMFRLGILARIQAKDERTR